MKISVHWLNTYLDRPSDADEIEDLLTRQGFPIESRTDTPNTNDVMLDVEVTSNRSDCLSHLGLAREVAAGSARKLIWPAPYEKPLATNPSPTTSNQPPAPPPTLVRNDEPQLCPLYTARLIRDVQIRPSPPWLVKRLEAVGLRPINNVVDVTNFVLLELGQPLHAFDLEKLTGSGVRVRTSREGETFLAIDGSKHTLPAGLLLIADAQNPVALAGVMGGKDSEVTDTTRHILLESALFDPLTVRHASRALKLASDSSYRFERGVDPRGVEAASLRATQLILELAGGTPSPTLIKVGHAPTAPRPVTMRVERANQLLGIQLPPQRMAELLDRLELNPKLDPSNAAVTCSVPSSRSDLEREVDLIEEVARLHGFESVPVGEKISIIAQPQAPTITARRKLGQVLVAHGCHETINFTFLPTRFGLPFLAPNDEPMSVDDDRHKAQPMLRPSLVPSLLLCRKSNQDVGNRDVSLFETAATWRRRADKPLETRTLAILCDAPHPQHALRHIRSIVEDLTTQLIGTAPDVRPSDAPACSSAGRVLMGQQELGWLGLINPEVQALFDLQSPVAAAELDLDQLLNAYPPAASVGPLPRFPAVERDLSLVVPEKVSWAQLNDLIINLKLAFLENLRFLDAYRGKPIPAGSKSVSLRLLFRDPQSTLRREQADAEVTRAVETLQRTVGAQLRT